MTTHVELFGLGENPLMGVSLDGRAATAVALDAAGNPLGEATTRLQSRDRLCVARSQCGQLPAHADRCSRCSAHAATVLR